MAVSNLKSPVPNFEIKKRLVFIPTEEFTKKFLENCTISEVAYLYPYDSFTKKLFKMEFRYYKDENGYEFKMFGDPEKYQIKMIVEKEFDHEITTVEQIEMTNYISKLGHDVYIL